MPAVPKGWGRPVPKPKPKAKKKVQKKSESG